MNRLKVRIMDNGNCNTVEINPIHPHQKHQKQIELIVEEYISKIRQRLDVDLMVQFEERPQCYVNQIFKVEDFDEAVKFLKSRDEVIF